MFWGRWGSLLATTITQVSAEVRGRVDKRLIMGKAVEAAESDCVKTGRFSIESRRTQSPNRTPLKLDGCPRFAKAYLGRN
jgi:hypothetical protein